jgi:D-alanyl-D-alanine carboxypeptidase
MMSQSQSNAEYYYAPLKGIKTGSTPEAGRCFVSTATRDGFTYLLVILGAPYLDEEGNALEQRMEFVETRKIYDWVFATFRVKTLVDKGKHVGEIPLRLNMDQDRLRLMTADRFTALLPADIEAANVTFLPHIPDTWDAPVTKGERIGEVSLLLSGEEIGRVDLLAAETVEASQLLILLENAKSLTRTFWFKFAVVLIVFLTIYYAVLMIIRNRNMRKRGYKPRRRV